MPIHTVHTFSACGKIQSFRAVAYKQMQAKDHRLLVLNGRDTHGNRCCSTTEVSNTQTSLLLVVAVTLLVKVHKFALSLETNILFVISLA